MTLDPASLFDKFDLQSRKAVIAAVSGGSDSLAMLVLLDRWSRTHSPHIGPHIDVLAVTVDHGLRAESRAEAEAVARFCASRGISHRTMNWTGAKPGAGVAAAGREARYRLLAEAAVDAETDIVVTGHTADDQAETVAMRQSRGDGRGLAGMAPVTLFAGACWIVRPLLGIRRAALRGLLSEEGVAWFDDPTNENPAYERPRLRNEIAQQVERLANEALAAGEARAARGRRAARLIAAHASTPMRGLVRLDQRFLQAADEDALLALRVLLAVTGGVTHLPEAGRSAALLGALRTGRMRATLSRSVIDGREGGVFIYREARGLPPETCGVWDGRYLLDAIATVPATGPCEEMPASVKRAVTASNPPFAASAAPVLAPWRLFLPGFDLPLAGATASLVGAAAIPDPPYREHNRKEA